MKSIDPVGRVQNRLNEYVEASMEGNRLASRNALRALLDECRSEDPGIAGWAKTRILNVTGISFEDLIRFNEAGQLSLAVEDGPMSFTLGG